MLFGLLVSLLSIESCIETGEPIPATPDDLSGLILPYDTVLLEANANPFNLSVFGEQATEISFELSSSAIFSGTNTTEFIRDTVTSNLDPRSVAWQSENETIVTVSDGVIYPLSSGETIITCYKDDIVSNAVFVTVTSQPIEYTAPSLEIYPPLRQLVLTQNGTVEGKVELGALLLINDEPVSYNAVGEFSYVFSDLSVGENVRYVQAVNPNDPMLISEQSKTFIYEKTEDDDGGGGDDDGDDISDEVIASIEGRWEGLFMGHSFYFDVVYNDSNKNFDVLGSLSFEYSDFGFSENITIRGLINNNLELEVALVYAEGDVY